VIIGAVDTAGRPLPGAEAARLETIVVDDARQVRHRERIPNADRLIVEWPRRPLAEVQPDHATACSS
jgi:hypothetical protein